MAQLRFALPLRVGEMRVDTADREWTVAVPDALVRQMVEAQCAQTDDNGLSLESLTALASDFQHDYQHRLHLRHFPQDMLIVDKSRSVLGSNNL